MTLFWRIFLVFWLTMGLMAGAVGFVAYGLRGDEPVRLHGPLAFRFEQLQRHLTIFGSRDLPPWRLRPRPGEEIVVADAADRSLGPQPMSREAREILSHIDAGHPRYEARHLHGVDLGIWIESAGGEDLQLLAMQRMPTPPPLRNPPLLLALAVLISGIVCWLLARALTVPIDRLSVAAHRLADGDLAARVTASTRLAGGNELARLGDDFNRMAAGLEQAMLAQKRLLHDVSHELRSPLARIRLANALARQQGAEESAKLFDRIDSDCEQLDELVGELLALPRLDAQQLQLRALDLLSVLREVVAEAEFQAQSAGKSLVVVSDLEIAPMAGSESWLRRAIANLISNALRHAPDGSTVTTRLHASDGDWLLSVEDRGPGIPEETLARIFEPFFRVESARERDDDSGGVGLGLAIVERVVRAHGGSVTAENTAPGLRVTMRLARAGESAGTH